MNLKEAFRYQNFLQSLMHTACSAIQQRDSCLRVTRTHLKSKANPDAQDIVEEDEEGPLFANDDVIRFMTWLIDEKEKLTEAIGKAKASVGFDMDAAVEANKFRQLAGSSVNAMLRNKSCKRKDVGKDYKFNVEGNQSPYFYDIEVVAEEAFDRKKAKDVVRSVIEKADEVSARIDAAVINTRVDFEPVYNVNDSFEDIMASFLSA